MTSPTDVGIVDPERGSAASGSDRERTGQRPTASDRPPSTPRAGIARIFAIAIAPLLILAAVTYSVARNGDTILDGFGHNPPPADELVVERTQFYDGRIELKVANPQADAITPVMITVDSAIVNSFEVEGGSTAIGSRESRTLVVPYEWDEDDPYLIGIVSSSGVTTDVAIDAAVPATGPTARGLGWGAMLGSLVGIVPVALGLAWLPALRRLSPDLLAGFLAFTAGLLVFLAIDAAAESFDVQARLVPALGGAGVVAMGVAASMVALGLVGRALRRGAERTAAAAGSAALSGGVLALLVAIGIGLHNFGEGLAIGSSFSTGSASLAISLVLGFMVHNLTEGVGIAAPIARDGGRLGIARAGALALVAGVPAIAGIWTGRYFEGPLFTTLCFAIAAGAALQVVVEIVRSLRRTTSLNSTHVQAGFALGLVVMWLTGILAG